MSVQGLENGGKCAGYWFGLISVYIVGTDAGDEAAAKTASGKYVPPSQRAGAGGRGEMMADRRDDYFTLRITNLRYVSCD